MASRRSVHFPLEAGKVLDTGGPPDPPDPAGHKPSIVVLGDLGRDHLVIGEQLKALHHDEASYHGKLQVILSALRRMQAGVVTLIEEVEK